MKRLDEILDKLPTPVPNYGKKRKTDPGKGIGSDIRFGVECSWCGRWNQETDEKCHYCKRPNPDASERKKAYVQHFKIIKEVED